MTKEELIGRLPFAWKEYFWSQSFCLLTTGGAPINILKKYIESQGIKNGKKS